MAALAGLLSAQQQTHPSQVMGGMREYRVHLPASYAASQKRYPVIYWLHGYEAGADARDAQLDAWTAKHEAIVIDSGPVETSGNYPLYLPELTAHIDRTLRTVADRDHRAVSGAGVGGFLALWLAATSTDLVANASAVSPARSVAIGPRGFEVDTVLDDLRIDYESVRTRLFNSDNISAALDYHVEGFTRSLPKPTRFDHADPYPNFTIWGWDVTSPRRRPGMTLLENVSARGFRSVVREWLPAGSTIPEVKLSVTSAPLFQPRSSHTVSYIPLAGGKSRRVSQRADAEGRLTFELDGGQYEIGIGMEPALAITRYELVDAAWATAGVPIKLRLTVCNKGGTQSPATTLKWESPTTGVKFAEAGARVGPLAPGESITVPLTFTATVAGSVRIAAVGSSIDVPVYPPAPVAAAFTILDEGDHEGHASPGESFALTLPDGRAELITADPCVDTSVRVVEDGVRYTHATVRSYCQPGQTVRILARTPNTFATVTFPVWYKLPQESRR